MTDAKDWQGRVGVIWAEQWRSTERAFAGLVPHLDEAILAATPADPFAVLDIGCGVGSTARALATARPDARVVGADLSDDLIAVARTRCDNLTNIAFQTGDAIAIAAAVAPLDLAISRHGVMFFDDPVRAFAHLRAAMRPAGRLVFSCFAAIADNPWATLVTPTPPDPTSYTPGPFAFANPDATGAILAAAGWVDATPTLIRFAYRVGAGDDPVDDAVAFLSRIGPAARHLRDAAGEERSELLKRLRGLLSAQRNGSVVDFPAAAWIWTARATGEAS